MEGVIFELQAFGRAFLKETREKFLKKTGRGIEAGHSILQLGVLPRCLSSRSSLHVVHLWLRAEKKPKERRTHLTPEKCKELVKAGKSD